MKIIYVFTGFVTERDYYRCGCSYLSKRGYEVEIWVVNPSDYELMTDVSAGLYQGDNIYY